MGQNLERVRIGCAGLKYVKIGYPGLGNVRMGCAGLECVKMGYPGLENVRMSQNALKWLPWFGKLQNE